MIKHHPDDDLLLAMAAGRLPAMSPGRALVIATHLEGCRECRSRFTTLQALGGALLELAEPQPLAAGALAATLQRIANAPPEALPRRRGDGQVPSAIQLPRGVTWPDSLRGVQVTRWRWMGPGRRFARVQLPHDTAGSLILLRIEPGYSLPRHRHDELEFTQVLCGTFADERGMFGPGDFDVAGSDVQHEPLVQPGTACVCLTWVEGRLQFDGGIAAAIARWAGV